MRLKQLEIQGFKSFPTRTLVEFAPGVTAIVGPNGCGKSNVVDAIRWVLGEQSPRLLRGTQMEDVLFKGSDGMDPSNLAEVSLTFEVGDVAGQLAELDETSLVAEVLKQFPEVRVTRRLFRSGEAEYLINGRACRMRDVTEMFLGTGVGARSYAIIEQGRVEQLISAKPEERRVWIEEVAGTTLFRTRKIAAERKMERTRENLHRVNDILRELDRQLSYMRRLARRAEQAQQAQAEIREIELTLVARQRDRVAAQSQELQAERDRSAAALASAQQDVQEIERAIQELRESEHAATAGLNSLREHRGQVEAELQSVRQREQFALRQQADMEARAAQLVRELQEAARQLEALRANRQHEREERAVVDRTLVELAANVAALRARSERVRLDLAGLRSEWESLQAAEMDCVQQQLQKENELHALRREFQDLETRRIRFVNAAQESEQKLRLLQSELLRSRARTMAMERELEAFSAERKVGAERVEALTKRVSAAGAAKERCSEECMRLQSRVDTLEDLCRRYEGFEPGVRRLLLESNGRRVARAVVADVIRVPSDLERAVAAALGDRLQCLIVEDSGETVAAVSYVRQENLGRASFIPLRGVATNGKSLSALNGTARPLADLVDADEQFQSVVKRLLRNVALVPDLECGLAYRETHEQDLLLVTPEGETIDPQGVVTGGQAHTPGEELLARKRVLEQLKFALEGLRLELSQAEDDYQRATELLHQEEEKLRVVDREVHRLSLESISLRKDVDRLVAERKRLLDELEHALFQSKEASERLLRVQEQIDGVAVELQKVRAQRSDLEPRRLEVTKRYEGKEKEYTVLESRARALELSLAAQRERHEALVRVLVKLESDEETLKTRMENLRQELGAARRDEKEAMALATEAREQAARLSSELALLQDECHRQQDLANAIVARRRAMEERLGRAASRVEHERNVQGALDIQLAELRAQLEHLRTMVTERYQVALESIPPVAADTSEEEMRTRLESLRTLLERTGTVGSGLAEELQETEQRAEFLREQKADLERSLRDLQATIHRLDQVSRGKFQEAFEAVQEKFRLVVPRLFGGGEGNVILTDPNDLTTSGVEIAIRPPGKRLETIGLLSGGEKAMAAVALIFALFSIRPSPFCILDEVDAPLDDANVLRFTELVRELSEQSQFILITHNKRTMQAADRLYGVTMQRPGVSKLLAVELQ